MKKGFTLIELLGTIIIIALLSILIFPSIINTIKRSKENTNELTKKIVFSSIKSYIGDNKDMFDKVNGYSYCVTLEELNKQGYIGSDIFLDNENVLKLKSVQIHYNDKFTYDIVSKNDCTGIYQQDILKGSTPKLMDTLTPVIYEDGSWKVADINKKWYDYNEQWWANAVILKDGVSKDIGTILKVPESQEEIESSDILAMFVWIPRYEYKIEGTYGTHTDGKAGTQALPGEIKINFISKNKAKATDGYIIHPGFTFGDETLSGIWVGKFETSHIMSSISEALDQLGCNNESCESATGIRILPNVPSLRYNNVSNMFYVSRSMSRDNNPFKIDKNKTDTHMIKNSEWGAVAYLSQSKYGKYGNDDYKDANKKIYKNNSSNYITGSSGGNPNASSTPNGTYSYDVKNNGTGASTTGNIYGIYDMSGGSFEYVMGYYNYGASVFGAALSGDAGFTNDNKPKLKYYDNYITDNVQTACNGFCYGLEFCSSFVTKTAPWFIYINEIFDHSSAHIGGGWPDTSFRIALTK